MSDLNTMLREQARTGLQTQLDTAVTNGDTEAARKITADITKLEIQLQPKAPPFGDTEILAAIDTKAPWFGTDPKRSAKAVEFGKTMNPKKFATAEAFAEAVIKAVDEEFKPAGKAAPIAGDDTDDEDADGDDENTGGDEGGSKKPSEPKPKRTDAPGEAEAGRGSAAGRKGPWAKLSDAPRDVQSEINRTADKFAGKTKEAREKFVANALGAHYTQHLRNKKGK